LNNSNMPRPPIPLPAYALYGQTGAGIGPDRLHCESIAERSRLHRWEIRPHRHESLCQILVIERGIARAWLDGEPVRLVGPAVVTVPALVAHGFRFEPDIQGAVFTVPESHLGTLLQPHAGLLGAALGLRAGPLPPEDVGDILSAAAALRDEALGHAAWRAAALDAALLRLAVALARALPIRTAWPTGAGSRAMAHVQRLRGLVDSEFRLQPSQADLALRMGITPTQLNRACQQILGHPAQHVLHARLLLQAQRELAYTDLAIKQIAFDLGFADAAYFTRFFRRHAGQAPAAWRRSHRARAALAPPAA
jgi:AraC family transcriptional activator of pobA